MLASADGYCSIVVFDMSELGTVASTQQHHRQLANIAAVHSHPLVTAHSHTSHASVSSPAPALALGLGLRHSPAPPARSEREGSAASSIAALPLPPAQAQAPPLFLAGSGSSIGHRRPSSASSTDAGRLPTPIDESGDGTGGKARSQVSESEGGTPAELSKRALTSESEDERSSRAQEDGAPKKKRRVALTHLGADDGE